MNIVLPETKTSLLLNRNYQAFAVCTARAAIRHLMTGRVKGMDSEGNVVTWSGTELDTHGNSSLRWYNNEVGLYPDHPCLRSAPNHATGQDRAWAIPTIIVCTYHWGHHRRGTYNVSTRTLYKIYKGVFFRVDIRNRTILLKVILHVHPQAPAHSINSTSMRTIIYIE